MQSNIFDLIDLLVKMSGSNSNLDELKADLIDTETNIQEAEMDLNNLDEEMTDDKYFDASSEIVDRNIKISLVKKIKDLNRVKNDLGKELDNVKGDEVVLHNKLDEVREAISKANKYNNLINDSKDDNKESYNALLDTENARISKLVSKKEKLEEEYDKIQKKVEYLSQSAFEVNEKIKKEEDRLKEIENNLSNIKAYINVDAKEKDEQKYLKIKNKLDELNLHKEEIINDPVYIAGELKELIADDNKDQVEAKFNSLVDIVKEIPYMELENSEIASEMAKLDEELKSFDSSISSKEYQTQDADFIDERITYLDNALKSIKERTEGLNTRREQIENEKEVLSAKICNAESKIDEIDNSLVDYENYDFTNKEISKSTIQAAKNKLVEEKDNITSISEKYREDLLSIIFEISDIDTKLENLKNESESKENELDELNKKLALSTKSVNVLEEEKDKIALEKINKNIIELKNREQFKKSISEILNEFEMLNSSLEFVDKKTRTQRLNKKEEVKEEPVVEEVKEDTPTIENVEEVKTEPIAVEPVIIDDTKNEVPEIKTITEEEIKVEEPKEKLRVVEVIPINDTVTEKETNDEFMVNDFQDDDYIDFDTAMSSLEGN